MVCHHLGKLDANRSCWTRDMSLVCHVFEQSHVIKVTSQNQVFKGSYEFIGWYRLDHIKVNYHSTNFDDQKNLVVEI